MLGVLVKGDLDDGRGKARVNLFRHKHEIETGRTSSVGMEIMGFDTMGQVITSDTPGRRFYASNVILVIILTSYRQAVLGRNRQAERKSHHFH
jgi:GTPase